MKYREWDSRIIHAICRISARHSKWASRSFLWSSALQASGVISIIVSPEESTPDSLHSNTQVSSHVYVFAEVANVNPERMTNEALFPAQTHKLCQMHGRGLLEFISKTTLCRFNDVGHFWYFAPPIGELDHQLTRIHLRFEGGTLAMGTTSPCPHHYRIHA